MCKGVKLVLPKRNKDTQFLTDLVINACKIGLKLGRQKWDLEVVLDRDIFLLLLNEINIANSNPFF